MSQNASPNSKPQQSLNQSNSNTQQSLFGQNQGAGLNQSQYNNSNLVFFSMVLRHGWITIVFFVIAIFMFLGISIWFIKVNQNTNHLYDPTNNLNKSNEVEEKYKNKIAQEILHNLFVIDRYKYLINSFPIDNQNKNVVIDEVKIHRIARLFDNHILCQDFKESKELDYLKSKEFDVEKINQFYDYLQKINKSKKEIITSVSLQTADRVIFLNLDFFKDELDTISLLGANLLKILDFQNQDIETPLLNFENLPVNRPICNAEYEFKMFEIRKKLKTRETKLENELQRNEESLSKEQHFLLEEDRKLIEIKINQTPE